jgi:hypothetical protein
MHAGVAGVTFARCALSEGLRRGKVQQQRMHARAAGPGRVEELHLHRAGLTINIDQRHRTRRTPGHWVTSPGTVTRWPHVGESQSLPRFLS